MSDVFCNMAAFPIASLTEVLAGGGYIHKLSLQRHAAQDLINRLKDKVRSLVIAFE